MPVRHRFSRFPLALAALSMLAACSGGGGGGGGGPTIVPTSIPTSSGGNPTAVPTNSHATAVPTQGPTTTPSSMPTSGFDEADYTCPTSDSASSAKVRTSGSEVSARRAVRRYRAASVATAPKFLEVTYTTSLATRAALVSTESRLGLHAVHETSFNRIGRATRTIPVGSANVATLESALRAQAGVLSVTPKGARRQFLTVSTPYYPSDPYFNGFQTTEMPDASSTAPPPTYHVAPYSETNDVPGQWNMHAIGLERAFAYSRANNGSGVTNAGALGSSSVKVALIDTGADTTIPELSGKIVKQGCFIVNPDGDESTSDFETDPDGHGTDTAALAGANINNSPSPLGFAGAGGNVSLEEFRVDPTPDDNCLQDSTAQDDPQCGADPEALSDAIVAAVNSGANVISLSLGGGGCDSSGNDTEGGEGNAVADAIASNVVVVASSGNDAADDNYVTAPACINGVIAAGASALSDGAPTDSGVTSGSVSAPVEYVASYSQSGNPGASVHSAGAWGIVAPGGDPADAEATADGVVDDLHWIEDSWTSTPVDSMFEGGCTVDYPGTSESGTIDCRTLIAGTSMSAPTIAGAAALILSANSSYQSPSKMKTLLCQTADDISDPHEGCGRLNVYRAMATAVNDPTLP